MDDYVSIKVCVDYNGKKAMKYLSIPRGLETEIGYVFLQISRKFPCLLGKKFEIFWRDAEDDLIKISDDEELMFAWSQMPVMKKLEAIYYEPVKPKNEPKVEKVEPKVEKVEPKVEKVEPKNICEVKMDEEVNYSSCRTRKRGRGSSSRILVHHPFVVCDGCEGDIYGFRYKCLTCFDFDLCQKCEGKNNHSDHFMLRIPAPYTGVTIDLQGSQLGNWLAGNTKTIPNQPETSFSKKCCKESKSSDGKHHGEKHKGRRSGCRRHHFKPIDGAELLKTFSGYINDFTNLAGEINLQKQTDNASPGSGNVQTNQTENQNNGNTVNIEHRSTSKLAETINTNVNSFCNMIGNVIETVLAPHGVEVVDVYFDNKPPQLSTENGNVSTETNQKTESITKMEQEPAHSTTSDGLGSGAASVSSVLSDKKVDESVANNIMNNINSNSFNKDYGIFVENNIDTYDSDSDSSGCVVEDTCGWTLLNTEDDKNEMPQKPASVNSIKGTEEKDMDKIVEEFQKQMEVCEENKSGSMESIDNTDNQHSSEETRFVLVPNSTSLSLSSSVSSDNPSASIPISENMTSTTSTDSSHPTISNNSEFIPPVLTSAPETNSTTTTSISTAAPAPQPIQYSYVWPGFGLNSTVPPSQIDAPMTFIPPNFIPPNNTQAGPHMTHPFIVPQPPTTVPNNPFTTPASFMQYSNPPNHTYPQLSQNVRSTGQQTSILQPTLTPQPSLNTTRSEVRRRLSPQGVEVRNQLLSMGYTDEAGLLTEIIALHGGNINQVLDFLSSDH